MTHVQVKALVDLADNIAPPGEPAPPDPRWADAIRTASTDVLIGLTATMNSEPGKPAAKRKALREAVISEIERKNSELIRDTMLKLDKATIELDKATIELNKRMYWIAVAGVMLALAQVVTAVIPLVK